MRRCEKAGWSPSPQAEEDKEEPTASQLDASSSQTATPVTEPPSTEPAPPDGPTSLGPLDLLSREELLTDTSNSSSSTGEEGETDGPSSSSSFPLVIPKWESVSREALVHRVSHACGQGFRSNGVP